MKQALLDEIDPSLLHSRAVIRHTSGDITTGITFQVKFEQTEKGAHAVDQLMEIWKSQVRSVFRKYRCNFFEGK